ncbi:permease [Bacillus sp. Leaf13]|nr:permease [Bacillus sp. Leaf13]
MANIVKIRASVFIPMSWTEPKKDIQTGKVIQFEGDSREFTPYAVNTMRSRVEQEVVVDFYKKEIFSYANSGITTERVTNPDGSVNQRTGKARTEGILCTNTVWSSDDVKFQMSASASNPLNVYAPPVDYLLTVQVKKDGSIDIQGAHDGFPCFEFYKQVNFGPFEQIYTHDFRETGDTPEALAGEMEYSFKKIL